jgi:hypothetical protein
MSNNGGFGTTIGRSTNIGASGRIEASMQKGTTVKTKGKITKKPGEKPEVEIEVEITKEFLN